MNLYHMFLLEKLNINNSFSKVLEVVDAVYICEKFISRKPRRGSKGYFYSIITLVEKMNSVNLFFKPKASCRDNMKYISFMQYPPKHTKHIQFIFLCKLLWLLTSLSWYSSVMSSSPLEIRHLPLIACQILVYRASRFDCIFWFTVLSSVLKKLLISVHFRNSPLRLLSFHEYDLLDKPNNTEWHSVQDSIVDYKVIYTLFLFLNLQWSSGAVQEELRV